MNVPTQNFEHIDKVDAKVRDALWKTQAKYKAMHGKHRVPHQFEHGDKVWLCLDKLWFKQHIFASWSLLNIIITPSFWLQGLVFFAWIFKLILVYGIHNVMSCTINQLKLYDTVTGRCFTNYPSSRQYWIYQWLSFYLITLQNVNTRTTTI